MTRTSVAPQLRGWRRLLALRPGLVDFDRRRFRTVSPDTRQVLEAAAGAFLTGFNLELAGRRRNWPGSRCTGAGLAEGAAMAGTLLDLLEFVELYGQRGPTTPKSKVLGRGSFKGMGVTFTDLNGGGRPDILVSNITTPFGLHESNHTFVSTGTGPITGLVAPYRDDSEPLGLSRTGWALDIKVADFNGDGTDEVVQALGFVRGERNRWPELQELAMSNDGAVEYLGVWPNFEPGDDIARPPAQRIPGPRPADWAVRQPRV